MLPVLIASKSDRLLFLLNWFPYLLMPGLVFLFLRTLGVSRTTRRIWMWVLPTGYCYALQAGGLQNDGYSVNYTLAAVVFAGLARASSGFFPAVLAVLAMALLTGAKFSNLPLMLPLLICLLPALKGRPVLLKRMLPLLPVFVLCSFLPLTVLCIHYTGYWLGDPRDVWQLEIHNPVAGFIANLILQVNDWVHLPIVPMADRLNEFCARGLAHIEPFVAWLKSAHRNFYGFSFGETAYEGSAGIGFGVFMVLLVSLLVGWRYGRSAGRHATRSLPWVSRLVPYLALVAFGVFLAKVGSASSDRLAAAYYPLLIVPLLRFRWSEAYHRSRLACMVGVFGSLTVVPLLIITPVKPLIPTGLIARWVPGGEAIKRKYEYWSVLRDDLAPMRRQLPPEVPAFGFAGGFKDTSYGLWKPFGRRVFYEIGLPGSSRHLPRSGLSYAVVSGRGIEERYGMPLADWLRENDGVIRGHMQHDRALTGDEVGLTEGWYLVRFLHPYREPTLPARPNADVAVPRAGAS